MSSNLSTSGNSSATGGGDGTELKFLYDLNKLTSLSKWKEIDGKLAEIGLIARPLKEDDFDYGYVELLSELTIVGEVTKDDFVDQFNRMRAVNQLYDHYFVIVFEDKKTKKIVATSTLFLELKIIHECSIRGRLEDVAVLSTYRGKGLGQMIVSLIVELAKEGFKCYKLTLDCDDKLKKFYQLNDFIYGSNMMSIKFYDTLKK